MAVMHPSNDHSLTMPQLQLSSRKITGMSFPEIPDSPESGVSLSPTSMSSASVSNSTSPSSSSASPPRGKGISSDLLVPVVSQMSEETRPIAARKTSPNSSNSRKSATEARFHPYSKKVAHAMTESSDVITAEKPPLSYIALISRAILSTAEKRMILGDIYQHIMDTYPYYDNDERAWRNSIRHNLSLNECFVKSGRAENGKGHYWSIHPNCVDDFSKGDYRRRQARRRARRSQTEAIVSTSSIPYNYRCGMGYVPMSQGLPMVGYNHYAMPHSFSQQQMASYAASPQMIAAASQMPVTNIQPPESAAATASNPPSSSSAPSVTSMANLLPPVTGHSFSVSYPGSASYPTHHSAWY